MLESSSLGRLLCGHLSLTTAQFPLLLFAPHQLVPPFTVSCHHSMYTLFSHCHFCILSPWERLSHPQEEGSDSYRSATQQLMNLSQHRRLGVSAAKRTCSQMHSHATRCPAGSAQGFTAQRFPVSDTSGTQAGSDSCLAMVMQLHSPSMSVMLILVKFLPLAQGSLAEKVSLGVHLMAVSQGTDPSCGSKPWAWPTWTLCWVPDRRMSRMEATHEGGLWGSF